jgi:hypothetical protein
MRMVNNAKALQRMAFDVLVRFGGCVDLPCFSLLLFYVIWCVSAVVLRFSLLLI